MKKSNTILFTLVVSLFCLTGSALLGCHKNKIIQFDYKPEKIASLCSVEQERVKVSLQVIGSIPAEQITFKNVVVAMDLVLAAMSTRLEPAIFLKYVSTDSDVRDAADKCEEAVSKMYVDIFTREDLYKAVKAIDEKAPKLNDVEARLLEDYVASFERNGLKLSAADREIFITKKKKLVELTTEYSKNLLEWKDHLAVTSEELDGMSQDYISGLKKTEDGKYKVTMAYPHYFPFMENGTNADVRKRLQEKFYQRGGDRNRELLEEAITLRHELATLLGFETHAAFQLDRQMVKTSEAVLAFENRLAGRLKVKGEQDMAELLKLKQEELGDPSITTVHAWDWRYYENLLKEKKFQVDQQKIKEYFPLHVVNKGMFEIYQTLFGVEFVKTKEVPTWHDSVLAYAVKRDGETMAYFYLDLFPREGKYGHAAAFTLRQGYQKLDGSYQKPISSVVANFNAPVAGKPSLLRHSQVETHFHEFGHIMHQILTRAEHPTFSGTSVKRDFVEAPSQMLENWVWNKESLAKLSGHYKDPSKPLPDELLDKLLKAKLANVGIRTLRQIFFGLLDMTYHTSASVDSTAVYKKLMKEIMLIDLPDGAQPQASFGHLMGGYDAGYYGYLWSEVYAQDMFTRFEKEGLLNPETGMDYVKWILEPGGSKDPLKLIVGFLGREPNEDAFLKSIGLDIGQIVAQKN